MHHGRHNHIGQMSCYLQEAFRDHDGALEAKARVDSLLLTPARTNFFKFYCGNSAKEAMILSRDPGTFAEAQRQDACVVQEALRSTAVDRAVVRATDRVPLADFTPVRGLDRELLTEQNTSQASVRTCYNAAGIPTNLRRRDEEQRHPRDTAGGRFRWSVERRPQA
jgi:hypothetical protein